jgi:hypothetical protein
MSWNSNEVSSTYVLLITFLFFGQSDLKRKNQLTCLFIFCIKSSHFARQDRQDRKKAELIIKKIKQPK